MNPLQLNLGVSQRRLSLRLVYQLVLQFAPWSQHSLNDLIALEGRLSAPDVLGAAVDGHDIGVGEANIFVLTTDPQAAFDRVLPIVDAFGMRMLLGAGVRDLNADDFVRWWPIGDARAFVVR